MIKVKPIEEVISFLDHIAKEQGIELVDGKWDLKTPSLTLFIDAEGGIDMDQCERFHRAVDEPLDELDPTFGAPYTLNCSSLGLDRPFKTERDFMRYMGEKIEVRLYAPIDGKKYFEGKLLSYENGTFRIQCDKQEREFLLEKTAKVCLCIEV